ncbi:rRNA processing protein [Exophiala xenobiotica]|uniref:Pre-rRNA-processing protein n=1 Tax=Lithohypha guttulata TaxID=1690604 RepID=A0ABR0KLR7_9EURO|nr:rRNA processing protein [Lithohypha guttulata]KAK5323647.1 rRNA processing protein [Exophiala xenobiotica]
MGSSAKRKKEKKKDFQKPKLKVGKAKPLAANATSTSFKAKAIVLSQKINADAPSPNTQFLHHVSLLSSRADSQRKESLAYLASTLDKGLRGKPVPMPTEALLDKAMPLILDANSGVRAELIKMLQALALSATDLGDHVTKMLPFVRAAMTHLSQDIRKTALDVLSWLLRKVGQDLVSSPGGWSKSLECCSTLLNWKNLAPNDTWTANKENQHDPGAYLPLWDHAHHQIPTKASAYGYLNLFGKPVDDDSRMLEDREERLLVFDDRFRPGFAKGIDGAKKEGGDIGRIAGQLSKTLEHALKED